MAQLPQVTGEPIVRALERAGWVAAGGSGSHRKLKHPDKPGKIVIVAVHGGRPIPSGTLNGILQDAELTVEAFKELL